MWSARISIGLFENSSLNPVAGTMHVVMDGYLKEGETCNISNSCHVVKLYFKRNNNFLKYPRT